MHRFGFFQLRGDYNTDRAVEEVDYGIWCAAYGFTSGSAADGNGDGIVDAADYTVWRDNLGATIPAPPAPLTSEGDELATEFLPSLQRLSSLGDTEASAITDAGRTVRDALARDAAFFDLATLQLPFETIRQVKPVSQSAIGNHRRELLTLLAYDRSLATTSEQSQQV